jgi:putative sigma-54 modulation protein
MFVEVAPRDPYHPSWSLIQRPKTVHPARGPDERKVSMQIEVKGRNVSVTEDFREHVERRFTKVAKQVSDLARLEIEIHHERNPANPDAEVVEATLFLKGATLRASDAARDFMHALNLCEEELSRQVKRHCDKRRKRRESRAASARGGVQPAL